MNTGRKKLLREAGRMMFLRSTVAWVRSLTRGNLAGQRELKRCTRPGVGGGPQTAAMRFDDGTADTKSHTSPLRLGGKERTKDLVRLLRRKPHAGIADREQNLSVFGLL